MMNTFAYRKLNAYLLGALLLCSVVLLAGCGNHNGSGSIDISGPTVNIRGFQAPTHPAGGTLTVSADAVDISGLELVTMVVTGPNHVPISVVLSDQGNGNYNGSYNVPANGSTSTQVYSVTVTARDGAGNSGSSDAVTFQVPALLSPPPVPL